MQSQDPELLGSEGRAVDGKGSSLIRRDPEWRGACCSVLEPGHAEDLEA